MAKYIRFDWAIKKLLCSKANYEVLEGFLSELTKQELTIKTILESEGGKEDAVDKYNRVDLLVENEKGELIIIEVQNQTELDYLQRILYGTAKVITEYIKEGEACSSIKKIISVSIVYFDLGQGEDYIYHGTTNFVGIHKHDVLQLNVRQKDLFRKEQVSELYPEFYLLKVNQFDEVARDKLDEWIYFLKTEEIKEEFQARGLSKAREVLNAFKMSEEERRDYQRYLENLHYQASMYESTFVIGKKEGEKIGLKKGEKRILENLVIKNYKEGKSISDISDFAGISEDEVVQILKKHKLLK